MAKTLNDVVNKLCIYTDADRPSARQMVLVLGAPRHDVSYPSARVIYIRDEQKPYVVENAVLEWLTPIAVFGIRPVKYDRDSGVLQVDYFTHSSATYLDGKVRNWQESMPDAVVVHKSLRIQVEKAARP